ncbi:unnamed protein product, partial [Nippostrongylus brasiliensis]|uniref:Uncharacterized protein n=1 Tax=Nippostrongylus brasiliensis TaxID=27835 RepID=A0A0N4XP68_NIPBR
MFASIRILSKRFFRSTRDEFFCRFTYLLDYYFQLDVTTEIVYLQRKGIDMAKYRPAIRFNPDKIQLIPKNPVIPGCIKIK